MSLLKIRIFGDPVLRKKAEPVTMITPKLKQLALDMLNTMYEAPGIGLAAPQVGESIRLVVIDLWDGEAKDKSPMVFFNPVLSNPQGSYMDEEGCLSFPDLHIQVPRYEVVTIDALDIEGKPFKIENATDLLARCIQHELDHLDGVLFVDRLSGGQRLLIQGKLKKMAKKKK